MGSIKNAWWRVPKPIRKPLVFIFGFAIVGAGLIMLITPGPGWVAIFLGFAILATEFAFAEKVRDQLVAWLKSVISELEKIWKKLLEKHKKKHKQK